MIRNAGAQLQPAAGKVFWCTGCDRVAQERHVRERRVRGPPTSSTLFHTAVQRSGNECGGQVLERGRHEIYATAGGTGGRAAADAAGHLNHGLRPGLEAAAFPLTPNRATSPDSS